MTRRATRRADAVPAAVRPRDDGIRNGGWLTSRKRNSGAPDRSRTCDLWLRKPTLYPTELRAHESESYRAGRTSVQPRFRGGASHGTMLRFSGGDRRERAGKPPTALVRHATARRTRTRTRNAMHEPDQHVSPIKNWKQLVVVVVLAFVVPIAIIVLLTQYVTNAPKGAAEDESAVLSRIKPVGEVQLAVASGPKGQLSGEQVYNQVCKPCHEAGLAGAPKVGDKPAWAKVIAQGLVTTVDHAVKGIRAMPPKGGNP